MNKVAQSFGVLAEINERLESITPDQFVMPTMKADERHHIVGVMPDQLKQLFTLWDRVFEECHAIATEYHTAVMKAAEALHSFNPLTRLRSLLSSTAMSNPEVLQTRYKHANALADIVKRMFWEDARRTFPELDDKPNIGVCEGWAVFWVEEEESSGKDIADLFGPIPPELLAMLRGRNQH